MERIEGEKKVGFQVELSCLGVRFEVIFWLFQWSIWFNWDIFFKGFFLLVLKCCVFIGFVFY